MHLLALCADHYNACCTKIEAYYAKSINLYFSPLIVGITLNLCAVKPTEGRNANCLLIPSNNCVTFYQ